MAGIDGRSRLRRRLLLGSTALVLAAGATVLGVALGGSDGSNPAGANGAHSPRAVTQRAVARLLAAAPVPPSATRAAKAPVAALAKPLSEPASTNLVRRTAWWVVPGGVDQALAFVTAHRPAGVTASGSQESGGGSGPTVRGLTFDATGRQWRRPDTYAQFELSVAATADGNRTVLRVDAEAIWLPARSASARIPDSVTSVDVVEYRGDGSIALRRTLPAGPARRLADEINALPTQPPGEYSCPMDDGRTDGLTLHAPGRAIAVRVAVTGCGEVTVGGRGRGHPILTGGRDVHAAIGRELKRSR